MSEKTYYFLDSATQIVQVYNYVLYILTLGAEVRWRMLKLAHGSSNFSVSSVDYDRPVKPKREAQKRKNVHFDDEPVSTKAEPSTMSTATFIRQKGMQWKSLAHTFGCDEDFTKDDAMLMNELLNLCSFWADSEPGFESTDEHSDSAEESDSDDDLECLKRLAMFTSSVSTDRPTSGPCSSSSSGVSSLRFGSILRLNSHSRDCAVSESDTISRISSPSYHISGDLDCQSQLCTSTSDHFENAFRGVVDDNEVSQSSDYIPVSASNDFWSQVEF
ncbi:unnamed protein product [Cylicocyclus nassatus]|uniref:Uncharacterized protein n=1 Tax=Cylicocyclus nassatus TaxID=53992 RepID=A0AA36GDL0_CYLNA|nr:unnamed protein product [Cylicocyclus nassatus]